MKSQNVLLLMTAIFAFIFAGCTQEIKLENESDLEVCTSQNVGNPDIVTMEEVSQLLSGSNRLPISRDSSSGYRVSTLNGSIAPAIYVVNFDNGGWVLLSAVKTYEPVLAYSNEGEFDTSEIEMVQGVLDWTRDIEADIERSLRLPEDSVRNIRSYWELLLNQTMANPFPESRVSIEENVAMARRVVADSLSSWSRKGYTVKPITELNIYDTEAENLDAIEDIKNNTYWALMEDFERYSYIVEYTESLPGTKSKELNLSTTWNQVYPYNSYFPNNYYTGCTTIAAAQIMLFHKWPSFYNWSNIYPKSYTDDLGQMLYDLAGRIGVEYGPKGTGAKISEVKDMFNRNGYSANVMDFNDNSVQISIGNYFPVFAGGENSEGTGHAWVISGYSHFAGSAHRYHVYYMPYPTHMISSYDRSQILGGGSTRYRCNWGWGGKYDGYYSSNFNPGENSYGRKNKILITTPNK